MDPGELKIHIGRHPALTLRVESARSDEVELDTHWRALSVAWEDPPSSFDVELWVDACMPENGARKPYDTRATAKLREHNIIGSIGAVIALAWANPDAEYPGAVTFHSTCSGAKRTASYEPLSDAQIGDRLYDAWCIANDAHNGKPRDHPQRRTSLSGMRGKIGLTHINGEWHAPHGDALSTWIAKHEDSRRLRGEAGIESLCQEAMHLLGVPSARTRSRVFDDQQCVLSERADRYTASTGEVFAIHQEDFAQATSWPGGQKYDAGSNHEPRWPAAYELLRRHAAHPEAECEKLTRMLAAMWMLGHGDLHRRNLGFTHFEKDRQRRIRLAPMYDVSSAVATRLDQTLAIGIARQQRFSEIGTRQWLAHARECGLDPERTLQIVRNTIAHAPEAIASARATVRTRDENRHQDSVDRRAEALIEYAQRRHRVFTEEETTRRRKTSANRQPTDGASKAQPTTETGPEESGHGHGA